MNRFVALLLGTVFIVPAYAADVPISGLPAAGALTGAELTPVVQSGVTDQSTAQAIANLAVDASKFTTGTLAAARLPAPTATTLGGIKSLTLVSHKYIQSIDLTGLAVAAQPLCGDLSDAGTACPLNIGTSGGTIPLLNGTGNTWSNVNIYSGGIEVTGGSTVPSGTNQGYVYSSATKGLNLIGQGSTSDFELDNKTGLTVCTVATGTTILNCVGLQVGGNSVLTANQTITLSGDASGSGTTSINVSVTKVSGDANVAFLDVNQSWTKGQAVTPFSMTDASSITPDFATSNNFTVTIAGNRTIANPSNVKAGQCGFIAVTQDATGTRTLTWNANWKFSGATPPTLTTTPGKTDMLTYCAVTTTYILTQLSIANGP